MCQHYRSRDDTEAQRLGHLRSGRYKMVLEPGFDPSDDDFEDKAGADIMESSTDQNF